MYKDRMGKAVRIAVCGKFKSGKTSLLNLLLGLDLPVSAVTATRAVTRIEKGNCSYKETEGGVRVRISTAERNMLISGGEETKEKGTDRIIAGCGSPFLGEAGEIEFWDTPGLEDKAGLTKITMRALAQCDLAIFVFDAVKFASWQEKKMLKTLQGMMEGNVIFVVNKIDLTGSEENLAHVKKSAEYLLKEYGNDMVGYGCILYTCASPFQPDISALRDAIRVLTERIAVYRMRKEPVVYPLSGRQSGMRIPLNGVQLCFGRDREQCRVLYEDGTPKVSRLHCTLLWNEDRAGFILADMGSFCGTFLEDGTRLYPGQLYEVRPGESFYLGDMTNEVITGFGKKYNAYAD